MRDADGVKNTDGLCINDDVIHTVTGEHGEVVGLWGGLAWVKFPSNMSPMPVEIERLRSYRSSKWVIIGAATTRKDMVLIPRSWAFDNERDARAQWDLLKLVRRLLPVALVFEINADKDPMIRTLQWDYEEPF